MQFQRGDVVKCKDEHAYARLQARLIACDGTSFPGSLADPKEKQSRPYIVVSVIPASSDPNRPALLLLCPISSGVAVLEVGKQVSFRMPLNYLAARPIPIPNKPKSCIVYGLGTTAREDDVEKVFGETERGGGYQRISLNSTADARGHEAALNAAWRGNEHFALAAWDANKPTAKPTGTTS